MTQRALANKLNVDEGELSKKIRGNRRFYFDDLIMIADALRTDARDLIGDLWKPPEELQASERKVALKLVTSNKEAKVTPDRAALRVAS